MTNKVHMSRTVPIPILIKVSDLLEDYRVEDVQHAINFFTSSDAWLNHHRESHELGDTA